jgi:hypothetical protein
MHNAGRLWSAGHDRWARGDVGVRRSGRVGLPGPRDRGPALGGRAVPALCYTSETSFGVGQVSRVRKPPTAGRPATSRRTAT